MLTQTQSGHAADRAWTGRRIRLLLCAAVARVESAPWGRIISRYSRGDRQASYRALLASGCAAGLPARGAIG